MSPEVVQNPEQTSVVDVSRNLVGIATRITGSLAVPFARAGARTRTRSLQASPTCAPKSAHAKTALTHTGAALTAARQRPSCTAETTRGATAPSPRTTGVPPTPGPRPTSAHTERISLVQAQPGEEGLARATPATRSRPPHRRSCGGPRAHRQYPGNLAKTAWAACSDRRPWAPATRNQRDGASLKPWPSRRQRTAAPRALPPGRPARNATRPDHSVARNWPRSPPK